jgi:peptidoglycan/xylan/chitin deacetylase (PgdA/CDA1 family)
MQFDGRLPVATDMTRPSYWRQHLWLASCIASLAGCAGAPRTGPVASPEAAITTAEAPAPAAEGWPGAAGQVIGRNEKLLIYQPQRGDRLDAIAARLLGRADRAWQISEANPEQALQALQPLVVPLAPLNPTGVRSNEFQTVPILCYHRFGTGSNKMVVSPASFAAQLEWLAQHGYRVIRLSQLVGFLAGREALPPRSVVITFDDGYESVYRHAFPLLRKHGFPATLFVYTDFVGTGDGLGWSQLAEMAQSGLVDVQAHSKTHRNLIERAPGETDDRYRQAVATELRAPREMLERRLSAAQVQVRHFAYPFGDANEVVLDAMTRQRYDLGVTVNPGGNAFFSHPLMLRRTMIFGDHDLEDFKSRLQTSRRLGAPW